MQNDGDSTVSFRRAGSLGRWEITEKKACWRTPVHPGQEKAGDVHLWKKTTYAQSEETINTELFSTEAIQGNQPGVRWN